MKNRILFVFFSAFFSIIVSCASCGHKVIYKDDSKPVQERVEDLLKRMTLEEKVGQMCQYVGPEHIRQSQTRLKTKSQEKNDDAYGFYPTLSINDLYGMVKEGLVGSFLHVVTAEEANLLQSMALQSRLQIPLLIGIDAIHGDALVKGATVYPTPIGQASSFDVDLVERICRESAQAVRAAGAHWTFTPNVDVARDPRWGRTGETFGEDPYLVSRMGVATVKGFQGDACARQESVLSCGKHLIAGSEPANGTNASPMDVSERTLREVFLPPYKAIIQEAGVRTLMAAHNELNGVPCHSDNWMMNDIIRKEFGFNGFIVSDWMDVERINELHKVAPTMEDAYYEAVDAGLDMHMHGPGFMEGVVSLVRSGKLGEDKIDRACRAILEAKFQLGLFENPFVDESATDSVMYSSEHLATALEAAEKSIVLLKNEDSILPLELDKYKKIFVTGPNANNHSVLGDWTLRQPEENVVTVLEGIRAVAGDKVTFFDYGNDVRKFSPQNVQQAAALASMSDLAIVVVGENPLRYLPTKTSGENVDRMSLSLLGSQLDLIKSIHSEGVPVIVIVIGGRPLSINWIADNVPAVLQAWEPGSLAGVAIANILFGEVNPSAKLPITIPRSEGQIQMIYNHKPSQYFHKYCDGESSPLYPFGYGLSYTTFAYNDIELSKSDISSDETIQVKVSVTNTGNRYGEEIVQLYIRDEYSSATRPVKELKDFVRIALNPNESKEVVFNLTNEKLAFYDRNMRYCVEPGDFTIMVGSSSRDEDLLRATLTVR